MELSHVPDCQCQLIRVTQYKIFGPLEFESDDNIELFRGGVHLRRLINTASFPSQTKKQMTLYLLCTLLYS